MLLACALLLTPADLQQDAPGAEVRWVSPAFGSVPGLSGFVLLPDQPYPQLLLSGGRDGSGSGFLHSIAYSPVQQDLAHLRLFAQPDDQFLDLTLGDVAGASEPELVRLQRHGRVEVLRAEDFALLGSFMTASVDVNAMTLADVEGDHRQEVIIVGTGQLYVHDAVSGVLLWNVNAAGGKDVVAGQFDGDPALEIATGSGTVVDAATRLPEWSWTPPATTTKLVVADLDGDGIDELIAQSGSAGLTAYDLDGGATIWFQPARESAWRIVDVENDGRLELLFHDTIAPQVVCSDARTLAPRWSLYQAESVIHDMILADLDVDGVKELVWSAGQNDTRLQVVDWRSAAVLWEQAVSAASWLGPEIGQLDGGAEHEVVAAIPATDSSDAGKLVIFHLDDDDPIASSPPVADNLDTHGILDLRLRDVDADGRMEILVGTDASYDGRLEIWEFDGAVFTRTWKNVSVPTGVGFRSVEVADLDLDGSLEILGGVRGLSSGSLGSFVYAYDLATGLEVWRSIQLGGGSVVRLCVGDTDGDGDPELVALAENLAFYVWDLRTRQLRAIRFGPYTTLDLDRSAQPARIVVGTATGEVESFAYVAGSYVSQGLASTGLGWLDGLTMGSRPGTVWIGAQGRLHLYSLSTHAFLWSSGYYGAGYGSRVVELGARPRGFVSAGRFAIVGTRTTGF